MATSPIGFVNAAPIPVDGSSLFGDGAQSPQPPQSLLEISMIDGVVDGINRIAFTVAKDGETVVHVPSRVSRFSVIFRFFCLVFEGRMSRSLEGMSSMTEMSLRLHNDNFHLAPVKLPSLWMNAPET